MVAIIPFQGKYMIYKKFLIFVVILFNIACTQTIHSTTKEKMHINKTIQQNKIETKEAKEAYLRLQRARDKE